MSGYDFTLDGTKYRVLRGGDNAPSGYRETLQRSQVRGQDLSEIDTVAFDSRQDRRHFYQTSWGGGSRWEKPLITNETATTYATSRGFSPTFRGGELTPVNKVYEHDFSSILPNGTKMITVEGETYAIGSTTVTTNLEVYSWDPATDTFVVEAGFDSGGTGANIWDMTYDPEQGTGTVYVLRNTDGVTYFDPTSGVSGGVTNVVTRPGSALFMSNGSLVVYNSNTLRIIDDPLGSPSFTTIANDGMGKDWLTSRGSTNPVIRNSDMRLALSTSDGIFYVKNVETQGIPQPWVFRVDRDSSGIYISTPITTLPIGSVAVSLMWHLGSLIVACLEDFRGAYENNIVTNGHLKVAFYHYTNPNTGLIGLPLGDLATLDETPSSLLGAIGSDLYIGGLKRIWVYDAVRGGVHPLLEHEAAITQSLFKSWALVEDSDGDTRDLFLHDGGLGISTKRISAVADLETVVSFDTDTTTHRLESNFIDFGLPLELKTLTNIRTYVEGTDVDARYQVQIEVDNLSFTSRHTATAGWKETDISDDLITGYRFRFAVYYETTTSTVRLPFKEIKIQATSGDYVRVWDLFVDGSESVNVENEVMDPEEIRTTLYGLSSDLSHLTFIPNFNDYDQDATTEHQVKVQSIQDSKDYPGESVIHVQLVEV